MKRIIFITLSLIMLCGAISAQQDCPVVDCPGRCGRFIDNDGDGFCDHGQLSANTTPAQPQQEEVTMPTHHQKNGADKITTPSVNEPKQDADATPEKEDENPTVKTGKSCPVNPGNGDGAVIKKATDEQPAAQPSRSPYHVYSILIGTLILYIVSILCVKGGLYSKPTHRKIWNILLTITFLVSCLLGLLLAIFLFHGYRPEAYLTFLKLHVWFGIAMTLIALFHAIWHWNYFKTIFSKRKENK